MSRRSRNELHDLMIDAGCELLDRRGLAFDPPTLTYANVFQYLEDTQGIRLHRSQVHGRIWESQEHYRTDVVIAAIRTILPPSDDIDARVAELTQTTDLSSIRDLVEGWVHATIGEAVESEEGDLGFDIFMAAQALSPEDSSTSTKIREAAVEYLQERMARHEHRYDLAAQFFDLELAEDFDLDRADALALVARATAGLTEGARLMTALDSDAANEVEIVNSTGETETIDPFILTIMVFLEQLLGLEP